MLIGGGLFAAFALVDHRMGGRLDALTPPPWSLMGLGFYMLHNSFQTQVTEVAPHSPRLGGGAARLLVLLSARRSGVVGNGIWPALVRGLPALHASVRR